MATEQTFAIIFGNVPSHYTVKDIILNHLTKSKSTNTITTEKLDRWRKAIRLIDIVKSIHCHHIIHTDLTTTHIIHHRMITNVNVR